jgi:hypothetical protein
MMDKTWMVEELGYGFLIKQESPVGKVFDGTRAIECPLNVVGDLLRWLRLSNKYKLVEREEKDVEIDIAGS